MAADIAEIKAAVLYTKTILTARGAAKYLDKSLGIGSSQIIQSWA